MSQSVRPDYEALDRPLVLERLFYPRVEWGTEGNTPGAEDLRFEVEESVFIAARFHPASLSAPTILFFHGNGEIVADCDDMGPIYNRIGINFLPVDYRGYGRSSGHPTVSAMMRDCHVIFKSAKGWLEERGHTGPLVLMGRSLGSASVLELAASYSAEIGGLIVESGFAYAAPLLRLLGIDPDSIGFKEEAGFRNVDKIRRFTGPTLIIHAEADHIIAFSDAEALFSASEAPDKTLLKITGADHNDLFLVGRTPYLAAVKALMERIDR